MNFWVFLYYAASEGFVLLELHSLNPFSLYYYFFYITLLRHSGYFLFVFPFATISSEVVNSDLDNINYSEQTL